MLLAVVSLHEAVDLLGAVVVTAGLCFLWSRLRRKDQLRRVERKERQAETSRELLRRQKEWDEAQRYFGAGAR